MTDQELAEYRARAVALTIEWFKNDDFNEGATTDLLSCADDISQFLISGTVPPEKTEDEK